MDDRVVTVFGGSGFVGRSAVEALFDAGWRVRIAARHPAKGAERVPRGVERVAADIRDESDVDHAIDGATAVVNAVSLYVEHGDLDFETIHVRGAERLARRARAAGVERLVHISGLGTHPDSPSRYVRARARGEAAVRDAFERATILRPSVMFGLGDSFLANLDRLTRLPVVPLFGQGNTRLQPVYVDDTAAAIAAALALADACGRLYQLGGGEQLTYRAIVEAVMAHQGRQRPLLPVPFALWNVLAATLAVFPNPPLTRDQIMLMQQDSVPDPGAPGFVDFGIQPCSFRSMLPVCLPAAR